ncbi:MAG: KDO2-lipid IV(A) lauroyltransferase [Flavobacterium sp.]|jgi:KDO2-lipid IV(A) lauroyltransferase
MSDQTSIFRAIFRTAFLHPKYWPTWLVFALASAIVRLPYQIQVHIGAGLGRLAYTFAAKRKHIAKVNLQLCFPDFSEQEITSLLERTFRSTGIGLIETANSWLKKPSSLVDRFDIIGLENLKSAMANKSGVLLVGMHSTTLDLCGAVLSNHVGFDVMYRQNKNLLIESIMTKSREKNYPHAIQRNDVRTVLKNLKNGHAVWYGPDQDYGRKHSVFVPFFNIETATITATARFARISGAQVICFTHYRRDDDKGYVIELSKPLENYPSGDEIVDATRINIRIEDAILKAPDQYWWIHRRFKTRPIDEKRPY